MSEKEALATSEKQFICDCALLKSRITDSEKRLENFDCCVENSSGSGAKQLIFEGLYNITKQKVERDLKIKNDVLAESMRYREMEQTFLEYLDKTANMPLYSLNRSDEGAMTINRIAYLHRWSKPYSKRMYKRLMRLEKFHQLVTCSEFRAWCQNLTEAEKAYYLKFDTVNFVTFTTSQDMRIEDQIVFLKKGLHKFIKYLQKKGYSPSYLAVLDFHKTGYSHFHVLFFGKLPVTENRLKKLWAEWGYGNEEHGLNFRHPELTKIEKGEVLRGKMEEIKTISDIGNVKLDLPDGVVKRVIAYMFKHSFKVFQPEKPGWLRFHSVVYFMQHSKEHNHRGGFWGEYDKRAAQGFLEGANLPKHEENNDISFLGEEIDYPGIRLFSMSNDISKIMRLPDDDKVTCLKLCADDGRVFYDILEGMDSMNVQVVTQQKKDMCELWDKLSFGTPG